MRACRLHSSNYIGTFSSIYKYFIVNITMLCIALVLDKWKRFFPFPLRWWKRNSRCASCCKSTSFPRLPYLTFSHASNDNDTKIGGKIVRTKKCFISVWFISVRMGETNEFFPHFSPFLFRFGFTLCASAILCVSFFLFCCVFFAAAAAACGKKWRHNCALKYRECRRKRKTI